MKRQLFGSKEDRTGEMGSIRSEDELSDSEQLSQINRFEGYVQIEGWKKIESTDNVRLEIRFPNGKSDEVFFDWPSQSFEDSEFGQVVHELGYTAETVDMLNDSSELFPFENGELVIDTSQSEQDVSIHGYKFNGFMIMSIFPVFLAIEFLDYRSGIYWEMPDGVHDLAFMWSAVCSAVWTGTAVWFILNYL